jgi:K+-transporting ATPase KdpF subunit
VIDSFADAAGLAAAALGVAAVAYLMYALIRPERF